MSESTNTVAANDTRLLWIVNAWCFVGFCVIMAGVLWHVFHNAREWAFEQGAFWGYEACARGSNYNCIVESAYFIRHQAAERAKAEEARLRQARRLK